MLRISLSVVLVIGLSATSGFAQKDDLVIVQETSVKLDGLGRLGKLVSGKPVKQTTRYNAEPPMLETEQGDHFTTSDVNARRMVFRNEKEMTWSEVGYDEMFAFIQNPVGDGTMPEGGGAPSGGEEEAATTVKVKPIVDAKATGAEEEINKIKASQVVITLKFIADIETETEEGTERSQADFFAIIDTWRSTDIPNYHVVEAVGKATAEAMQASLGFNQGRQQEAMKQIYDQYPELAAVVERVAEEMAKVEGADVRTRVYYGTGKLEDPMVILNPPKKKRGGLRRLRKAVEERVGAESNTEGNTEVPSNEPKVLFSSTTEMKSAKAVSLKPEDLLPNDKFEKVPMPGVQQAEEQ